MRSLIRSICWVASAGYLLIACGSENPTDRETGDGPPPPAPSPTVTLAPNPQTLALGQTTTLRATVSGSDKPVLFWDSQCESGSVAVAVDPLGTLATITATRAGACIVGVTLDGPAHRAHASARIRIPPLPFGEACSSSSECATDASVCTAIHTGCGRTCTRTCSADADCPAPFQCVSSLHLCRAILYPDDRCASDEQD